MSSSEIISPLEQLRDGMALIRKAVAEHSVGALPVGEHAGVEPLEDVEAVRAIHAIAEKPGRRTLRFEQDADDRNGWSVYSGGLLVATIRYDDHKLYEPEKPWIWSLQDINAPPDFCECLGYEPSLDSAKQAIVTDFKKWLAWAEL